MPATSRPSRSDCGSPSDPAPLSAQPAGKGDACQTVDTGNRLCRQGRRHPIDGALERARRGIEVFRRTRKTGCRIEHRQLGYRARPESCLVVDPVMAWGIDDLMMMGRVDDDLPCTVGG